MTPATKDGATNIIEAAKDSNDTDASMGIDVCRLVPTPKTRPTPGPIPARTRRQSALCPRVSLRTCAPSSRRHTRAVLSYEP
eukprot:5593830-Pleurochrysis_carterae.AAC.1